MKFLARIIKSFIIAFSMYSRIPMPRVEWKEEDMKYVFVFFPFVGAVIGALFFAWNYLCFKFSIPEICRVCVAIALPLIITGGIHADGFMDTMDAINSYRDREKKLELLKDPHIGAFSVIMLLIYVLSVAASLSVINDKEICLVLSFSFVIARILSGYSAITFKNAKVGTLNHFSKNAGKITVLVFLIIEMTACVVLMFFINILYSAVILIFALLTLLFYYFKTKKEFGGITGDTAGCFVLLCEGAACVGVAVTSLILNVIIV